MAQLEEVLVPRIESAQPMPVAEMSQLNDLDVLGSGLVDFWKRLCELLGSFEVQKAVPRTIETSFTHGLVGTSGCRVSSISGEEAGREGFRFLLDLTTSKSDPVMIDGRPCDFHLKTGPEGGLAVLVRWINPPAQQEARWVIPADQLPAQPKF